MVSLSKPVGRRVSLPAASRARPGPRPHLAVVGARHSRAQPRLTGFLAFQYSSAAAKALTTFSLQSKTQRPDSSLRGIGPPGHSFLGLNNCRSRNYGAQPAFCGADKAV